ncbi:MAG: hypothetical protein ACKN89_11045 [Cyanobium sp.]
MDLVSPGPSDRGLQRLAPLELPRAAADLEERLATSSIYPQRLIATPGDDENDAITAREDRC